MAEEAGADRDGHGSQGWRRAPAEWLKAAASTTTALGVVTYAVLRVDYALFYDRFGLKPEDVGLGQAELISQSLSGVVLVLTLLFVELVIFAGTVWILGVLGRQMGREFLDVRRRHGTVTAILSFSVLVAAVLGQVIGATSAGPWVLLAVGLVALWWLAWGARPRPGAQITSASGFGGLAMVVFALSLALRLSVRWTVVGFAGLLVVAVVIDRTSRRGPPQAVTRSAVGIAREISADRDPAASAATPTTEASNLDQAAPSASRRQRRGPPATIRRVGLVAAVVGTVALAESVLALSAVSDANNVRSGHAVEPTVLGVPLVSWGARAVEVAWDGKPPAGLETLAGHCFLYLGQGGGAVLLYDHDAGRTIRIPSGAVVLSIQPVANYQRFCPR